MACGCDAEQAGGERCFDIDTNFGGGGVVIIFFNFSNFIIFIIFNFFILI